ncbi:MAG: hypothetical protein KatS3mg024_0408 [Armatimonadota bacterium]|nr:MAG: hypothetical protein KatS3mg024_0408 [Armatimonadota bacterium]
MRIAALLASCATLLAAGGGAQTAPQPHVLVFPVRGDAKLAPAATQALKASLKQGNTVVVTEFRPDLPSLRRAVAEGLITRSALESEDPEARRRISAALEADFYLESDILTREDAVALRAEAVQVSTGRRFPFSAEAKPAEPGGAGRESLVLSVAGTVVSKFMTEVLGTLPPAAPPRVALNIRERPSAEQPTNENETPSTPLSPEESAASAPVPAMPQPDRQESATLARQAESLAAAGDLAGAIQAMRQAVNLAPSDLSLRLKLAGYYTRKGMTDEAAAELRGALLVSAEDRASRLELARQLESAGLQEQARQVYEALLKEDPRNTEARLAYGDLLWNLGKPDDAALEYAQAARDAPDAPAPHERLARLFASRGQFQNAMISLDTVRRLKDQETEAPLEESLYRSLIQSFDVAFYRQRDAMDSASRDYQAQRMTREDYYQKVRSLVTQLEELAEFLTEISPPAQSVKAHIHRRLGASLLSQAATSLQDWLVTGEDSRRADSERFRKAAEDEMDAALGLDRQMRSGG